MLIVINLTKLPVCKIALPSNLVLHFQWEPFCVVHRFHCKFHFDYFHFCCTCNWDHWNSLFLDELKHIYFQLFEDKSRTTVCTKMVNVLVKCNYHFLHWNIDFEQNCWKYLKETKVRSSKGCENTFWRTDINQTTKKKVEEPDWNQLEWKYPNTTFVTWSKNTQGTAHV